MFKRQLLDRDRARSRLSRYTKSDDSVHMQSSGESEDDGESGTDADDNTASDAETAPEETQTVDTDQIVRRGTMINQMVCHLLNKTERNDKSLSERIKNSVSLVAFQHICDVLGIILPPRSKKKVIYEVITTLVRYVVLSLRRPFWWFIHASPFFKFQIDGDEVAYQQLSLLNIESVKDTEKEKSAVILGKDVMAQVWADMQCTRIPTWISAAPRNWGSTQRGKLSADNWCVICTIHLPITLIWLWRKETGQKQELLRNFMDLVTAVQIANMRISSPSHVSAYNQYITSYAEGLKVLFPHKKLKPTLHGAFHIGDMMLRFGPGHSHKASYYERYIGFFHKLNTNGKLGMILNKSRVLSIDNGNF